MPSKPSDNATARRTGSGGMQAAAGSAGSLATPKDIASKDASDSVMTLGTEIADTCSDAPVGAATTWNMQHATRNTQKATGNMQQATCNTQHTEIGRPTRHSAQRTTLSDRNNLLRA